MGTAQLKNRMEGSGRRQLTGEPTFLTQVPKESDANTPSALPSPSYTVYFVCSHPLGRGVLLGQWALSVLFSGMFWGWDQGSIPGGSSHSPAFCKCPLRAGGSHLLLAASLCSLLFVSLPHSVQLGFELRLDMHFLALWHCTCHLRNKSKRNSLGSGKNMTSCCDFLYFVLSLKLEKHP